MARQTRGKLNRNGLAGLGLEKLIDILLEEAAANKALKARLQTALAGESGPQDMAQLIDKRLDTVEQAKTRISSARARDLATEFSGLVRNIVSELGGVDPAAGGERILRFVSLRFLISPRLVADSARLWKVFDDAEASALQLIAALSPEDQVRLVPFIERFRLRDRYNEHVEFLYQLVPLLGAAAAEAWKQMLAGIGPKDPGAFVALDLLQGLALRQNDIDGFVALEKRKPENRQDSLLVARVLHEAGRHEEALHWVRIRPAGMRILRVAGIMAGVGSEYGAQERRLLESEILERLKRRGDAQEIRWKEFTETFDPAVLRLYLSKLDDFAEFDELDKAFAFVNNAEDIHSALDFLIAWPRWDMAAAHVLKHVDRWDGRQHDVLSEAAVALADEYPLAATILYRVLVNDILQRRISPAYVYAAAYLIKLEQIAPHLPATAGIRSHAAFAAGLRQNHRKKYDFWSLVPSELQ